MKIDLRLTSDDIEKLNDGESVIYERLSGDVIVLIPELDEDEDESITACSISEFLCKSCKDESSNECGDDFEKIQKLQDMIIAEKMQKLVDMIVEIQKSVGS